MHPQPFTVINLDNAGTHDEHAEVIAANAAEAIAFYCAALSAEHQPAQLYAVPQLAPLFDIRLKIVDTGLWVPARVKDANGWRYATNAEESHAAISSPLDGYSRYDESGKYTQSGKYELETGSGAGIYNPTHVASYDTRKEARAALLAYLNKKRQPIGLATPLLADDFADAIEWEDYTTSYGEKARKPVSGSRWGYEQTLCTNYGIACNQGIQVTGSGPGEFIQVPTTYTVWLNELNDASDEHEACNSFEEALTVINTHRAEMARHFPALA